MTNYEPEQLWTLFMQADQHDEDEQFTHQPDIHDIREACKSWVQDGGHDLRPTSVVWWTLTNPDGERIDSGHVDIRAK